MKNILTLLCLFAFSGAYGQYRNPKMSKMKGREVICPASKEEHHSFVDIPSFANKNSEKKNKESNLKLNRHVMIEVDYHGFSDEAREAFQRAVDVWSQLLFSNVKVRIQAYYQQLEENVLGSAGTTDFLQNFPGAPELNTFYPIALAEKLAGRELNSADSYEISCRFNSDIGWNFGVLPTSSSLVNYDFTTVVLHELGHGLGFISTMGVDDSGSEKNGFYGVGANQAIFDKYIANNENQYLTDTLVFKNPSAQLYKELVSDSLYFDSPHTHSHAAADRVKLFAPEEFDGGSSISHLDEEFYKIGDVNSLMTPFAKKAEKILNPGPIVLNMFYDMGWISTSILHEPIKNMAQRPEGLLVVAGIRAEDDLPEYSKSFILHYLFNDGIDFKEQTTQMIFDTVMNQYKAIISIPEGVNLVDYYFSVKAYDETIITAPGSGGFGSSNAAYSFTIGKPDTEAPVLNYDDVDLVLKSGNDNVSIPIYVTVADNYSEGVDKVYIEYTINKGSLKTLNLSPYDSSYDKTKYDLGFYNNKIAYLDTNAFKETLPGDVIRYQIKAKDASGNVRTIPQQYTGNQSFGDIPGDGFYEMLYASANETPLNFYEKNFNDGSSDDFDLLGFNIVKPQHFTSNGLHTTHPYSNGVGILDPKNLESIIQRYERNEYAVLKSPIVISSALPTITFDEVVLVEPGDSGSVFNGANFYDYVVVEGTLDGKFWFPLSDGYDSRSDSTWKSVFADGLGTVNSKAEGTAAISRTRTIDFFDSGAFANSKAGDQMLIRFRLYSDQLTHSWGWVIDNLYIQVEGKKEQILTRDVELPSILLYPNPSTDFIKIETPISEPQMITVTIFSIHGKEYANYQIPVSDKRFKHDLDVRYLPTGAYVLRIQESKGEVVKRFVVAR